MQSTLLDVTRKCEMKSLKWFSGNWLRSMAVVYCGVNFVLFVLLLCNPTFLCVGYIYNFNTLVVPVLLLFLSFLMFLNGLVDGGIKRPRVVISLCVMAFLIFGLRVYMTYVEPTRLVLREVTIESRKVKQSLRILHISDIQAEYIGKYEREVFKSINELEPDLVLHTGDLLQPVDKSRYDSELAKIIELLRTLKAPLGVYTVLGDVDQRLYRARGLDLGGLKILANGQASIDVLGTKLNLFGLMLDESHEWRTSRELVEKWLSSSRESDFTVLMGHAPDYVLRINDLSIDLCLAGHTHGGQIRIPFYGPIVTASSIPREWARGYRAVGETRLNVSAGIGCEHRDGVPAMRLFCPTEMTLINVVPLKKEDANE